MLPKPASAGDTQPAALWVEHAFRRAVKDPRNIPALAAGVKHTDSLPQALKRKLKKLGRCTPEGVLHQNQDGDLRLDIPSAESRADKNEKCAEGLGASQVGSLAGNRKGCDFGYALAANSCEGAFSVEACTVTALERSPLSRFQTPADTSQCSRFFRVWRLFRSPGSNRSPGVLQSGDARLPSFSAADESCCFGYAPAASSCERANCVEACTASASVRSPLSRFPDPG